MDKLPWFRVYSELSHDMKLHIAARETGLSHLEVLGAWTMILCAASQSPVRGQLYVTLHRCYSNTDVTAMLPSLSDEQCRALIDAFVRLEMIAVVDGALAIVNWNKRQFTSDSSAGRVRAYRAAPKSTPVTPDDRYSNTDVTLHSCYSNTDVTAPDTDTDTDTDTDFNARDEAQNLETPQPAPAPASSTVGVLLAQPRKPAKSKAPKPKPTDDTLAAPAVSIYRTVFHRTPNPAQRELMINRAADADLWKAVCAHWSQHGWNPGNVPGLLDLYAKNGVCVQCHGQGRNGKGEPGLTPDPETKTPPMTREQLLSLPRMPAWEMPGKQVVTVETEIGR